MVAPDQRPHWGYWTLPVLLLVGALALSNVPLPPVLVQLPEAYLTLVRLVVSISAAIVVATAWRKRPVSSLALGAVALLYNPILPIHMSDDGWAIAHAGAALLFGFHWFRRGSTGAPAAAAPA